MDTLFVLIEVYLESYDRWHATADCPAPGWHNMHWWHFKESLPRFLCDYSRFR